jgi:hypothetical protein
MFEFISIINAVVCLSMFLLCIFAILHPSVNDGIVIKFGLILLTVGFGTIAYKLSGMCDLYDVQSLEKALLLVHSGAIVLVIGYVLRVFKAGHKMQRVSDWIVNHRHREIQLQQVSGGNDGS